MKERIRLFVALCFYYSGLVKLAHWWTRRLGRRMIILKYHRAIGGDLRGQMLYLRQHYRLLHLEEALEELYTPLQEGKRVRDRRIPMVLTFDDGYRDNYTHAFALARELQIPITIFIIPGYIESGDYFWWLENERLVRRAQASEVTIEGRVYHLNQPKDRAMLAQAIKTRLRYSRSVAEREAFLADLRKALLVLSSVTLEEEAALPLTWAQVRKMEESGWVSFGGHTMHHPILAHLQDPTEVRLEVGECRTVLEQQLGHPVRTFAYPVGSLRNIGDEALRSVKAAGYEWAVTTVEEVATPQSDPHLLSRISGDPNVHWLVMASELVGLLGNVTRLRRKLDIVSRLRRKL